MDSSTNISLLSLVPPGTRYSKWMPILGPALDRLLGITSINKLYQTASLRDSDPFEFASRALALLDLGVDASRVSERIPQQGPLVVFCNHPYGGIEALILANAVGSVRRDVKFLANKMLKVIPELEPLLIETDPLKVSSQNLASIAECKTHLENHGVLFIFPAGKVSYYQANQKRIADREWNRLVGHLIKGTQASALPVYFHGANSALFHTLGRMWDRSKILLLPRELLKLKGRRIDVSVGQVIPASNWNEMNSRKLTDCARVITYAQECYDRDQQTAGTVASIARQRPLAVRVDARWMSQELASLPSHCRLFKFKQYSVWCANAVDIPILMTEITRERERVFREHDEGSGKPRDTDVYDNTYLQLFVWNEERSTLIGAYRLGRTDVIQRDQGIEGLYLSRMFHFGDAFHDPQMPALELGRSFVVPEEQKSFHALYLLWKGIGAYLVAHPHYRRLYGTVSLSRKYDEQAIALICSALIKRSSDVSPRYALKSNVHPEVQALVEKEDFDLQTLRCLVRALDSEHKDLPVLLKHYLKLGADFHCVGVDQNFNSTPGLLLSLNVPSIEPKKLSTFLGREAGRYVQHAQLLTQDDKHIKEADRRFSCPSPKLSTSKLRSNIS